MQIVYLIVGQRELHNILTNSQLSRAELQHKHTQIQTNTNTPWRDRSSASSEY